MSCQCKVSSFKTTRPVRTVCGKRGLLCDVRRSWNGFGVEVEACTYHRNRLAALGYMVTIKTELEQATYRAALAMQVQVPKRGVS